MSGETPRTLLAKAQRFISIGDFKSAADSFSVLIEYSDNAQNSDFNPVLAVLSRASCYMQMKKFQLALDDALKALKLPAVRTHQELYPGCYGTRAAAASYAADASRALGKTEDFGTFKRMATELMKSDATRVQEAIQLKEKGNAFFKEGKLQEAMKVYGEALTKDSTNTAVLSNASLVLLKLGKAEEALQMAERCVGLKPDWSKGYYRKGAALLSLNKPSEAASVLQEGLKISPDDLDLKQAYMDAVTKANIAPSLTKSSSQAVNQSSAVVPPSEPSSADISHAKQMMGMMMDLKYNSWDVQKFFTRSDSKSIFVDFEHWDEEVSTLLKKPKIVDLIFQIMRLGYPEFQKGATPVGLNPYLSKSSTSTSPFSHILPSDPLLTSLLIFSLLTTPPTTATLRKRNWSLAFTHQADPSVFVGTSLHAHILQHKTYAVLVSRPLSEDDLDQEEYVLDFLGLWCAEVDGMTWKFDPKEGGGFMGKLLKAGGGGKVVYTCDEFAKAFEYVEGYYRGLNGDGKTRSKDVTKSSKQKQAEKSVEAKIQEIEETEEGKQTGEKQLEDVDSAQVDEDREFEELQKKVRIQEFSSGGNSSISKTNNRVCFGWIDRDTLFDVGFGTALAVAGASIVIYYM